MTRGMAEDLIMGFDVSPEMTIAGFTALETAQGAIAESLGSLMRRMGWM